MAQDIYFNGTVYPNRTGSDKYGTFYRQVRPWTDEGEYDYGIYGQSRYGAYGVGSSFTLETRWGSRIAEISGRVRGLAGVGTVPSLGGTLSVDFPINYFAQLPIFDYKVIDNIFLKEERGILRTKRLLMLSRQMALYSKSGFAIGGNNIDIEDIIGNNVKLVSISVTGFKVTSNRFKNDPSIAGGFEVILWHAFGL